MSSTMEYMDQLARERQPARAAERERHPDGCKCKLCLRIEARVYTFKREAKRERDAKGDWDLEGERLSGEARARTVQRATHAAEGVRRWCESLAAPHPSAR